MIILTAILAIMFFSTVSFLAGVLWGISANKNNSIETFNEDL